MSQLTLVATIKAKADAQDQISQALHDLLAPTRAEDGCINYDLHRSIDDPSLFVLYENWASKALWERHMQSPHLQAYQAITNGLVDTWDLALLTKIG